MLILHLMHITLQRIRTHGEYVHGLLSIDGNRVCDTLENDNGKVPAGQYQICLNRCKQYSRKMPCLNPNSPCDLCSKLKFICQAMACITDWMVPSSLVVTIAWVASSILRMLSTLCMREFARVYLVGTKSLS